MIQPNKIFDLDCKLFAKGKHRIYYYWNKDLKGWFITWMELDSSQTLSERLGFWKEFLKRRPGEIYFMTDNPRYIKNHMAFHGQYGANKVYRYVR